jgi:hypothetical protein
MKCSFEEGTSPQVVSVVTPSDDGRYEVICPKGHKSIIVLQQQKFEVLYDIGAYAIVDGYYREAVSSFTSSLERFFEFFCKVMLYAKHIDPSVVDKSWKPISKQSERQLGAFTILYTSEFKAVPILLENKYTEFRNDVIHNGKIPTQEEAVVYGQAVLDCIRPLLSEMKAKYQKEIEQTVGLYLVKCSKGNPAATMSISTILSLSFYGDDRDKKTLEQALLKLPMGLIVKHDDSSAMAFFKGGEG